MHYAHNVQLYYTKNITAKQNTKFNSYKTTEQSFQCNPLFYLNTYATNGTSSLKKSNYIQTSALICITIFGGRGFLKHASSVNQQIHCIGGSPWQLSKLARQWMHCTMNTGQNYENGKNLFITHL